MLKREITYTTFDDEKVTDTFYFHLSKPELVELETSHPGGLEGMLRRIMTSKDYHAMIQEFKKIILLSVGEKSQDGKQFIKTDTIRSNFEHSNAFETLFMEFIEDDKAAADFVIGVVPKDMSKTLTDQTVPAPPTMPPPVGQPSEGV